MTVEKKEGFIRHEGQEIILVDLPGAYSLSAYSQEEVVARNVLLGGAVQAVINVVDAGILERGLLLTTQLREMGLPVVIACNMVTVSLGVSSLTPLEEQKEESQMLVRQTDSALYAAKAAGRNRTCVYGQTS